MIQESVVKAVRLPKGLFDLVISANPGKTFTEIIRELLIKEYSFTTSCKQKETIETIVPLVDPNITLEEKIDQELLKIKKKDLN